MGDEAVRIVDLSLAGACIELSQALPAGTPVLKDGVTVGTFAVTDVAGSSSVVVIVDTTSLYLTAGYHGMHVHAGSNTTTGESGCVAPTFASAGGHFPRRPRG